MKAVDEFKSQGDQQGDPEKDERENAGFLHRYEIVSKRQENIDHACTQQRQEQPARRRMRLARLRVSTIDRGLGHLILQISSLDTA